MSVKLQLAQLEDSKFLYDLRFSDDVAQQSLQSAKPSFNEHNDWFQQALSNSDRHIYIIFKASEKVGMIRLDVDATKANIAEVSLAIHKDYRSQGIAANALSAIESLHPSITTFRARVKPGNEASLRLFTSKDYHQEFIILSKHRPN